MEKKKNANKLLKCLLADKCLHIFGISKPPFSLQRADRLQHSDLKYDIENEDNKKVSEYIGTDYEVHAIVKHPDRDVIREPMIIVKINDDYGRLKEMFYTNLRKGMKEDRIDALAAKLAEYYSGTKVERRERAHAKESMEEYKERIRGAVRLALIAPRFTNLKDVVQKANVWDSIEGKERIYVETKDGNKFYIRVYHTKNEGDFSFSIRGYESEILTESNFIKALEKEMRERGFLKI